MRIDFLNGTDDALFATPNVSQEATWDVPRFAFDGASLLSWKPRVGESPGASARGCYAEITEIFSKRPFEICPFHIPYPCVE